MFEGASADEPVKDCNCWTSWNDRFDDERLTQKLIQPRRNQIVSRELHGTAVMVTDLLKDIHAPYHGLVDLFSCDLWLQHCIVPNEGVTSVPSRLPFLCLRRRPTPGKTF